MNVVLRCNEIEGKKNWSTENSSVVADVYMVDWLIPLGMLDVLVSVVNPILVALLRGGEGGWEKSKKMMVFLERRNVQFFPQFIRNVPWTPGIGCWL